MTDLRQAAQQALEALEKYSGALTHFNERIDHGPAITALKAALEQQQAEPVVDEAIHAAWSAGYVEGEKAVLEQQAEPVSELQKRYLESEKAFQQQAEPVEPKCGAIIEVFGKNWRLEYLSLPVGKHKLYVQQYTYTTPPQQQAEPVACKTLCELCVKRGYDFCANVAKTTPIIISPTPPQQQAEPVHGDIRALKYRIHELEGEVMGYKRMLDVAEAASQPQQQAEPVAWMDREGDLYKMPEITNWAPPHTMLYTTPPQRQWVGLTDKEIIRAANALVFTNLNAQMQYIAFAQVIEAKLKEKNSD